MERTAAFPYLADITFQSAITGTFTKLMAPFLSNLQVKSVPLGLSPGLLYNCNNDCQTDSSLSFFFFLNIRGERHFLLRIRALKICS